MTQTTRAWTLLVYMAGDNGKIFEEHQGKMLFAPMENQGWQDIEKMEAIGSTDEIAVVVQFDTLSDREHTYRIYIPPKGKKREIVNIPEQNTGDPTSLRDFIVWGIENYPAQNYAVILWNHGTGWKEDDIYEFARSRSVSIRATGDEVRSLTRSNRRLSHAFFLSSITEVLQLEDEDSRAIAFDDSSMDFLDNAKLQQAFQEAEEKSGQKVSLIGMDACLMSMVEVAYQLRANANCLVASQEVEPMYGWPYTAILQDLTANPDMTSVSLAKLIVQKYGLHYSEGLRGGGIDITQSAINLKEIVPKDLLDESEGLGGSGSVITQSATNLKVIDKLAEAMGRLATILRESLSNNQDLYAEVALSRVQRKVKRFRDEDFADLHDFVKNFRDEYTGDNTELSRVLDEVINLIILEVEPQFILANVTGERKSTATGLSIYLPIVGYSQFYDRSDFASCGWGEFIRVHNKVDEQQRK
ncbi:MAG: clostripain-related cysteine peptidase [Cyanobacteria bacterium P01_A01_bin.80]